MTTYSACNDQELVALLRVGNVAAFDEIHHRNFSILFKAAYNVLKDRDACMDIVQDVFIWFWEHREQHEMSSIKGYMLMAVKYQVANYFRSGKVKTAFFERMTAINITDSFHDTDAEVKELKAIIKKFSSQLPERCGEVFRLSREEHLTNKEIAERLGISEKTVEAQITLALKRLRVHLDKLSFWILFL